MKKWLKISGLGCFAFLLLMYSTVIAQENNIEAKFQTRLESVLILNVDPELKIVFGLNEINDNLYQITKPPDAINFSVESTENWNLSITASDPYFRGVNDPSQTIPVEFLGFYIENLGTNWDNGVFSNISNKTKDSVITLTDARTIILVNGRRNNIGGSDRNSFILRWKFQNEDGDMINNKFSNMKLKDDFFIGRFYITLSESIPNGSSIKLPNVSDSVVAFPLEYVDLQKIITPGFSDKNMKKEDPK